MKMRLKKGAPIVVLYTKTDMGIAFANTATLTECEFNSDNYSDNTQTYHITFDPPQNHPVYGTVFGWQFTKETYRTHAYIEENTKGKKPLTTDELMQLDPINYETIKKLMDELLKGVEPVPMKKTDWYDIYEEQKQRDKEWKISQAYKWDDLYYGWDDKGL